MISVWAIDQQTGLEQINVIIVYVIYVILHSCICHASMYEAIRNMLLLKL